MCLAIPARVIAINGQVATVDMLGNQTQADISVLQEVKVGDYIIVHAGFGIQKYEKEEAEANLKLIQEVIGTQQDD